MKQTNSTGKAGLLILAVKLLYTLSNDVHTKWALGAEQQPVVSRALRLAFDSHYQYNDFIQLTFKMNYSDACLREVRVNHLIRLTDLIS